MGKYMSEDVMKKIVQNIDNLGLGGKKATVTVLFSDIRGFTSMSEKMSAQQVSELNKASLFEESIDKIIEERFPNDMHRKRKTKANTSPKTGDVISVRGFGRMRYAGLESVSKKGKENTAVDLFV